MIDKKDVELSEYGAGKLAAHESLKYIRDQEKIKPWAKITGLTLLGLAIAITVMKDDPPATQAPKNGSEFQTPSINGNQPDIESSVYNRGDDVRQTKSDKRKTPKTALKLSGPKLIARSIKIKVPPGTETKATLMTGASNGLVKVKLKEDVIVAGESFLAAGTILLGTGSSTDDRLFVHFTKAISDDASVESIEAEIADASDKSMGLKGSFWSTHGGRIAASAGLNFLAGASEALEDTQGEQGAVVAKPTVRNAVLNGSARAALEESNQVASKYKNSPPSVEIRVGTEVAIIFTDSGS